MVTNPMANLVMLGRYEGLKILRERNAEYGLNEVINLS